MAEKNAEVPSPLSPTLFRESCRSYSSRDPSSTAYVRISLAVRSYALAARILVECLISKSLSSANVIGHASIRRRIRGNDENQRSCATHRVDRSLSLVVELFHKTVDLASVQTRVILGVRVRMSRRLLNLMRSSYVRRWQTSRVRRNGHIHPAIAGG